MSTASLAAEIASADRRRASPPARGPGLPGRRHRVDPRAGGGEPARARTGGTNGDRSRARSGPGHGDGASRACARRRRTARPERSARRRSPRGPGVSRVLLGSVSEHCAEHAPCSVLVARRLSASPATRARRAACVGGDLLHADPRVHDRRAAWAGPSRGCSPSRRSRGAPSTSAPDAQDHVLQGADVGLRCAPEAVEQREGRERAHHLGRVEVGERRDAHARRPAAARPVVPPAPHATTGPNDGSCTTPTSISTPGSTISCTTNPSRVSPAASIVRGHLARPPPTAPALRQAESGRRRARSCARCPAATPSGRPARPISRRGLARLLGRPAIARPHAGHRKAVAVSSRSTSSGASHPPPRSSAPATNAAGPRPASRRGKSGMRALRPLAPARRTGTACASAIAACSGNA